MDSETLSVYRRGKSNQMFAAVSTEEMRCVPTTMEEPKDIGQCGFEVGVPARMSNGLSG